MGRAGEIAIKPAKVIVIAALLWTGSSNAALKGTVGATSDYLFRGIESSGGAAVQGDVYYAWDQGFYAGGWASNALSATTQVDGYAGYDMRLGDFNGGGGLVYRYFSAESGDAAMQVRPSRITFGELFVTGGFGPASLALYYSNDYFGTSRDALYVSGDVTLPVSETLSVILQGGYNTGPGVVQMWQQHYFDYRATLEKKLEGGFFAAFHIAGATRSVSAGGFSIDDQPKVLVSFKKEFDF